MSLLILLTFWSALSKSEAVLSSQFIRDLCYRLFASAFLTIIQVFKYFCCFLFLWFFVFFVFSFVFVFFSIFLLSVQFLQDLLLLPLILQYQIHYLFSLFLYLFISFFTCFLFFLCCFSLVFHIFLLVFYFLQKIFSI